MKNFLSLTAVFIIFSMCSSAAAAPDATGSFRIQLSEKKAVRETEIIPFSDGGADPRRNIKVRIHTTKGVSSAEKTAESGDIFKRDLGIWESDIIVYPKLENGNYPVDLIMSLRLPSGIVKRVEHRLEAASAEQLQHKTVSLDQLRNDFVDLVRNQYWPVDDNLADQFDQVLVRFASKHMRKMIADIPAAFDKQVMETERRVEILEKRVNAENKQESALEALVQRQFTDLLKEKEQISEDTDFVRVEDKRVLRSSISNAYPISVSPQYTRTLRFELTALAQNGVQRYQVADVSYHMKTIQFEDGEFRTNFRIDVRPMMRENLSVSKNFEHSGSLNEKEFLGVWKKQFWSKVSRKLINAGVTEQAKAERAYIISFLEPIIFSEQYAFGEHLTKAKLSFQSDAVQKEWRKLKKKF